MADLRRVFSVLSDADVPYWRIIQDPARVNRLASIMDDAEMVAAARAMLRPKVADESMTLAQRMASRPNSEFRQAIEENLSNLSPDLAARYRAGDPDAFLEAYSQVAANEGVVPARPTALIPYGVRGPGVPGDLSGPGELVEQSRALIPYQMRNIDGQTRALIPYVAPGPFDNLDALPVEQADFSRGSPLWEAMAQRQRAYDNIRTGRTANLRNQNPQFVRVAQDAMVSRAQRAAEARDAATRSDAILKALGTAAAATGAATLIGPEEPAVATPEAEPDFTPFEEPVLETGNPADLPDLPAGEISIDAPDMDIELGPATVESDELMTQLVPDAEPDYDLQASELITKLNQMRRAAMGEVPEAPAMIREIQRLQDMGNKQRVNPEYRYSPKDPAGETYQRARDLMNQANGMLRQGFGMSDPRVSQLLSESRRLFDEGNRIRNQGNR